jgi:hypothetical protein
MLLYKNTDIMPDMKKTIALALLIIPLFSYSQGYENNMVFGYSGGSATPDNDAYGLNILSFTDGSLMLDDNQESELEFNDTDAAISDKDGNLLFYFNGIDIYNASHQIMEGGDTLNEYNSFGYDLPQGGIIIPYPEKLNKYILFHMTEGYVAPWGNAGVGLYYSVIDANANNGLGKVIQRKISIVIDTLEYGKLAVVQHANGRDWWLVTGESWKNTFYPVLVDPGGVHLKDKQTVGTQRVDGIGQVAFSPDGTKYIMFGAVGAAGYTRYLDIYNFDRCSGVFSNHEHFEVTINTLGGGFAISPNSRWLYLSLNNGLYKFDLSADPIKPTQELVAEYEPFNDPFPTKFLWSFLAPDNKIYIVTTSGSRTLHVIHKPDEPGGDCAFEQHGIRLPCYNARSLPTFANYRLGPLDGSLCDTLGLDNVPVAWWRYEQDTLSPGVLEFTDLSYHEPATWSWDFGDGTSSSERHPVHTYTNTGSWQVCLTVSNDNGSDTHCKTIQLNTASAVQPAWAESIKTGPSPFRERLFVSFSIHLRSPVFRLFDAMGRVVLTQPVVTGVNEMDTAQLPPGFYVWEVLAAGQRVKAGKLVKVRA